MGQFLCKRHVMASDMTREGMKTHTSKSPMSYNPAWPVVAYAQAGRACAPAAMITLLASQRTHVVFRRTCRTKDVLLHDLGPYTIPGLLVQREVGHGSPFYQVPKRMTGTHHLRWNTVSMTHRKGEIGASLGGSESSPARQRRRAKARRRQEQEWRSKNGPVEIRYPQSPDKDEPPSPV